VVVRGAAACQGYGDRGADWMFVGVADLRDTGGHNGYPWEWSEDPVAIQAFRLYRNGRLLAAPPATRSSRWRCRRPGPATGSSAT
jgi:hypothetical protein